MKRRTSVIAAALVLPVIVLAAATYTYWPRDPPPPLAAPRQPILPDLTIPPLTEVFAGRRGSGTVVLFFTAAVANVGKGPFVVHAVRGGERGRWRVGQRFRETDGSTTESVTPGDMVWGGHGHDHWHVALGASYRLDKIGGDAGDERRFRKQGFCFFDQKPYRLSLPGARAIPKFPKTTCSGRDRLVIEMGLSVGWNDPYQWTLPDQSLPIVGLGDGIYRLTATADPDGWFRESNERNNSSWVELSLTTSVNPPIAKVLRAGP